MIHRKLTYCRNFRTLDGHEFGSYILAILITFGFSVFIGNTELDQVIKVLLGTAMFVGGFVGCLLDNTVPGKICITVFKTGQQNQFVLK